MQGLGHLRLPAVTLLLALVGGCATTPPAGYAPDNLRHIPPRHELTQVPFHPQQRYRCGPAALATVLSWSGVEVTADELTPQVYVPDLRGSLQVEILSTTRRHGRIPYRIPATLEALLEEVAAGNPVIVLQNLGLSWLPRWHYAVVVGYDLARGEVILRSGLEARHTTPLRTFAHTWARSDYWGIVVLAPDRLPQNAARRPYLQAVVELERLQRWTEARSAYETALRRWPDDLTALIGLGNTAFAMDDLAAAETAFRRAIEGHPDSAPAHNNLAQVLSARGEFATAARHARTAIDLGGRQVDSYRATLADIGRNAPRHD